MSRLQNLLAKLPRLVVEERVRAFSHHDLTEFTIFSKLPPELRNKVWAMASSEPRAIMIDTFYNGRLNSQIPQPHAGFCYKISCKCERPIPAILEVSVEARQEGLRHYELHLAQDWFSAMTTPYKPQRQHQAVYLNYSADCFIMRGA